MPLYLRDYTKLSDEEVVSWQAIKEQEKIGKIRIQNLFHVYPKAVRHFKSLFPNNYLDTVELQEENRLNALAANFLTELNDSKINEADVMRYIKENEAYFIIGSILKDYNFGHHEAYVFPEFRFGSNYRVDYLIVGKRSGGYEFIFVELEHPSKDITIKDGELGGAFRKGIKQINDWKRYLDNNFPTLEETFIKYKHPNQQLPREFLKLDSTRLHYVVVAGRRTHFTDNTYWHKRNMMDKEKVNILHFDNLYEYANSIIGKSTY